MSAMTDSSNDAPMTNFFDVRSRARRRLRALARAGVELAGDALADFGARSRAGSHSVECESRNAHLDVRGRRARDGRATRMKNMFHRALGVILASRAIVCATNFTTFDCDEAFNFWEPLHYLTHGHGLQTWEHGGEFALRSYAYLAMHYPVAMVGRALFGADDGRSTFALVRAALGAASAYCEADLVDAVSGRSAITGAILMVIFATNTGMAIASTAFLPSSFAMMCVAVATAAALRREHRRACKACVMAVVFGWPFSGIATIPFGLYAIYGVGFSATMRTVLATMVAASAVSVAFDSYMYSPKGQLKFVSSVFNLLDYNIMNDKSDLYGTEARSFYMKNLALNFQLTGVFALMAPFSIAVAVAMKAWHEQQVFKNKILRGNKNDDAASVLKNINAYRNNWRAMIFVCSPFPLVAAFFTGIPHKEERFLYMIYPSICLSAAIGLGSVAEGALLVSRRAKSRALEKVTIGSVCAALLVSSLLSLSRTAALLTYYSAPAKIYNALPTPKGFEDGNAWPDYLAREYMNGEDDHEINVCVGDEWYRFPSSYHFPSKHYRLRFIETNFDGALPMPFNRDKGGTAHTPVGLNDDNVAHPDQYVDPSECRFLVEADFGTGNLHSHIHFHDIEWRDVASERFIDPLRTPLLSRVFRLPGRLARDVAHVDYVLRVRLTPPPRPRVLDDDF